MTVADEAQRYLAVVEFFRAQGCEPRWRPEVSEEPTARPEARVAAGAGLRDD